MRKNDFELTVLLPCLNEEETIKICILKAKNCIRENNLNAEILVADNGSSDNSISIARKNGARVVSIKEKGYGSALIGGTKEAKGKYCIMADSDDSYDFSSLMPYIEKLREGYDLVMGNRFMGGIADGAMPFLHRYLGTPVLSFLGRALFNNKIGDYNCGMRGYNTKRILELNLNCSGMEYASEMIVKSSIYGYKICEVPTKLKKDGRSRKPHLNTWKDGWRHLIFMLKHAPKQVFFMTSIVFALISLFLLCSIKTDNIIVPYLFLMFSLLGILLFMLYLFSMIIAYKNNYLPFNDGLEKKIILKLYNSDSIFFIGLILLPISIFSLLIFKTTKIILVFTVLTFLSLILMFSDIYINIIKSIK